MAPELLQINDLKKSYGNLKVLNGVTCSLRENEQCVVIGPSGGGKSTLLRCVMGLEEIDGGEILFNGEPYIFKSNKKTVINSKIKQKICMVFQQFNLFPHITVLQNCILAPTKVKKIGEAQAKKDAMKILESVGLKDKAYEFPNRLSGGQRQRAAIERSLVMDPKLMLFDEITSALDPELIKSVLDLLEELAIGGMTMFVITHEMDFAISIGDKVIFLDQGKVADSGSPELITNPKKARTKEFLEHFRRRA
jgi:ABC-type polar amino acid transport system ATPase subunit